MAKSENSITRLKTWLEKALSWLHADGSQSTLQRSNQQLLTLMEDARNTNQPNRVWELIEELEELTLRMNDISEQGEIFMQCAKTAGDLENLKDALRLCQAAESKYKTFIHPHAVSLWMIGCIHWTTYQKVKAISSWQESITFFKRQQDSLQIDLERVKWYDEMIPKLESYLEDAITSGELPTFEEEPASHPASPKQKRASADEITDTLKLMAYTVNNGSVPAGGFRPVGSDPDHVGYLEVTEVLIENEPHKIYSTKRAYLSQHAVNISPPQEYKIVRVTGISMNAAQPVPINDGDYILVRLQGKARDNDIVVAGIFNTDTVATVKRLRYRDNKIRLTPESTDTNKLAYPDFEQDFGGTEVNIVGIVEAIFKKVIN